MTPVWRVCLVCDERFLRVFTTTDGKVTAMTCTACLHADPDELLARNRREQRTGDEPV